MDANQRESELLQRLDLDTAATVGVADGDGEGVTSVGLRRFFQAQHDFNHIANLGLARAAEAGDGLLYLERSVFVNRQIVLRGGGDNDAADLTEGEGDARILHVDQALDRDRFGLVVGDQFHHGIANAHKTARWQHGRGILEVPVTERGQLVAFGFDHAKPGGTKTGINTKNFHAGKSEYRNTKQIRNTNKQTSKNNIF